jgi:hypothetical protein
MNRRTIDAHEDADGQIQQSVRPYVAAMRDGVVDDRAVTRGNATSHAATIMPANARPQAIRGKDAHGREYGATISYRSGCASERLLRNTNSCALHGVLNHPDALVHPGRILSIVSCVTALHDAAAIEHENLVSRHQTSTGGER